MEKSRINKLRWACRRSSLELDMLLESFCEKHLVSLSDQEAEVFEALLQLQDDMLTDWLLYCQPVQDLRFQAFVLKYFHHEAE